MKQKVMKVGNSLCVTVPADFTKAVGIKQGDLVKVSRKTEKNTIIYKFSGIQQLMFDSKFLKKKSD